MGLFNKREVRGAISLFLIAILLPLMVISALMVDTARYQLAKSMVSSAGDLAMNAALADYDAVLKDVYGLFAMSQAEDEDVEEKVKEYFEQTVVSYGMVNEEDAGDYIQELLGNVYEYLLVEDKETADFLKMTIDDSAVTVNKVEQSSLANPSILEKQIVEYMKYRAPVGIGMSFLDSLSAFTKVEKQTDVVQKQVDAQYSLGEASDANKKLYDAIRDYDGRYRELEPEPPTGDRIHLKNYGQIFLDYVPMYEKLHGLALAFCVEAHLGKWDLPDSNRSDSSFVILNASGSYISQGETELAIPNHLADTNNSFGNNADDPLNRYITPFLNDKDKIINQLKSYGTSAKITVTPEQIPDEANWENAKAQFKQVDDFYKNESGYRDYKAALKRLDEYSTAMALYVTKMKEGIDEAKKASEEAEKEAKNAEEDRAKLTAETGDASARLSAEESTEEGKQNTQDGQTYLDNQAKVEELKKVTGADATEAADQIAALEQENQEISERLGEEKLIQITGDLQKVASYEDEHDKLAKKKEEAEVTKTNSDNVKEEKEKQLKEKQETYQEVLNECKDAVNSFNQDAINYKNMKAAVRDLINTRAGEISAEFKLLEGNIRSLESLLAEAENRYNEAQGKIQKYSNDVDTWDKTNQSYQEGGADNFSDVQSADIQEAQNVFSDDEVKELITYIQQEHTKVSTFLSELDANFSYMGGPKIKDITSADQITNAIQAKADNNFDLPHAINVEEFNKLGMLTNPVPCCSFLNYLHQTYKDGYRKTTEEVANAASDDQKANKATYDSLKNADSITKTIEEKNKSSNDKYGYTYGEGSFSASAKPDKDGFASQKKESSNMLSGLARAMEKGRDKLYVMAYLFDYFSYNTIVQDLAREGGEAPSWMNSKPEVYAPYKAKPITGSHIPINGTNNKYYGAEIEYVLHGKENMGANVTMTYASIFAIRALFNSVYAFTATEIRSQTRTAAMAVQMATACIVPYQLVQVVMQLALALAESAIDIKNMEAGAKVPIMKSKDTWTMSMDGVKNLVKGVVTNAVEQTADKVTGIVQNKINEIVDSTAEELSGKVSGIEKDLKTMSNSAAEEILNSVFAQINTVVDKGMNQAVQDIFYPPGGTPLTEPTEIKIRAIGQLKTAIDNLKGEIKTLMGDIAAQKPDNQLLAAACEAAGNLAGPALDEVYITFCEEVEKLESTASISEFVYKQIYLVKEKISTKVKDKMNGLISTVSGKLQTEINKVAGDIKESADKATKEATEEAKTKVIDKINDFVDTNLSSKVTKDTVSDKSLANSGGSGKSAAIANAITFGYSDYLRLFVFIGLCADNSSGEMIGRIGTLIQTNISSAGNGSDLKHRQGEKFTMGDARTYVSIDANVDLEMMFLRLGIFQRQVESFNEDLEEDRRVDLGETMKIHYLGIAGY